MRNKKLGQIFMWALVALVFFMIAFQACDKLYEKYDIEPDGAIEEFAEVLLEEKMGLPEGSIDLSPSSKE